MTEMHTPSQPHPLREIPQVGHGDHICLPFVSDEQRLEALTGFIMGGIDRGEQVLVVAKGDDREPLSQKLCARGIVAAELLERQCLLLVPSELAYNSPARFVGRDVQTAIATQTRNARALGFSGLRAAGAPPAELPREVLLDYEAGLDTICAAHGTTLLCMYSRCTMPPSHLHQLLLLHPQVMLQERVFNNAFFRPAPLRAGGACQASQELDWAITQILRSQQDFDAAPATSSSAETETQRRVAVQLARGIDHRDRLIAMLARQMRAALAHMQGPGSSSHDALEATERLGHLAHKLDTVAKFLVEPSCAAWRTLDLAQAISRHVEGLLGQLPPRSGPVFVQAEEPVIGRFEEGATLEALDYLLRLALRHGCDGQVEVTVERHGPAARVAIKYQGVDGAAAASVMSGKPGSPEGAAALYDWIGIDLFFPREIVRRLGGTFSIASWPDDTVIYTIELPRNTASSHPV